MKIYNSLEKFSSSVEDVEKVAEPISKDKVKAQVKFVVKDDSVSFIIGRKGNFTSFLRDELRVHMQCYSDKNNRALKYDENIVKLTGSLQDITDAVFELIKRIEEYYKQLDKNFKKYPLALLIPANLVTKIIGAGGCMIKEIS
jgi:transcription antitermination factor NusA-like protein